MKVTFICGCETKEIIARENIKTMDMVEFDTEGFLICAIHHQRRYGVALTADAPRSEAFRLGRTTIGLRVKSKRGSYSVKRRTCSPSLKSRPRRSERQP
jgi:hypothetical protein